MRDVRYRTEAFGGSGERDAATVMAFETFELGNTDILEYLTNNVLAGSDVAETMKAFIEELDRNGFVDDLSEKNGIDFFKKVLAEYEARTGVCVRYALWLADKEVVTDRKWYGRDMADERDFESYEIGDAVLSDLGFDGTLYGYSTKPVSLEERLENLREELGRGCPAVGSEWAAQIEERYGQVLPLLSKCADFRIIRDSFSSEMLTDIEEAIRLYEQTDLLVFGEDAGTLTHKEGKPFFEAAVAWYAGLTDTGTFVSDFGDIEISPAPLDDRIRGAEAAKVALFVGGTPEKQMEL